ncbi:hypothetical protein [Chengkuizengella axinellae]|uniref:YjcZ family sporulation protein n=1 Tax=Chengkuizengella axinellae TaxID=3064388 RepID=A0ABT9IV46_9BACL|nr:hypothetical protein [Chengkuizengella sp. 2205SS18-9]MDP5273229.1 hypothetical protein [Chengkuizengella sp. 2205SS18-9]
MSSFLAVVLVLFILLVIILFGKSTIEHSDIIITGPGLLGFV